MTEKKYPLRLKDLLRLRPTTSSWAQWSRRLLILGLIIVSLGVIGHLLIRFVVWPQIETSKPAIEKLLSERIGVSVKIDHLHVHWEGIRPVFDMTGLEFIPNPNQQTALIPNSPGLKIREIRGELSWSSVYHLKPHFNKLQASDAIIQVVRDKQERLFVAGILAGTGADDLDTQNWLFSQNNLELNNATILWKDFSKSKSDVADLRIETLALRSGIRTHELNIGLFSPWHQGKLSLSGKFVHRIGGEPGNWRDWIGDFQWDVQSLDIGQLTRDFEIPFKQLSGVLRSSGALSLSKGLPDGGQFALSIDHPIFQQSKSNQAIEFAQLELDAKQFTSGKFVSLGIQRFIWREKNQGANTAPESLAPMTFSWQVPKKNTEIEKFSFSSSKIGLQNLSLFALNLPLPSRIRQIIEQSEPRGELNDVSITWSENKSTIPLVGGLISGQGPKFDVSGKLNNVSVKRYQDIVPGIT
ncbi:MAG: membrane-like protein, partial [Burkholderiaceae bacterium]|nr:membrane-like protein [Burkholderiaceae bacterium]